MSGRPSGTILPDGAARRPYQIMDGPACYPYLQSCLPHFLTSILAGLSKIKLRLQMWSHFPVLGGAFQVSREGFPMSRRATHGFGNGSPSLSNNFPILEKGFQAFCNGLPGSCPG